MCAFFDALAVKLVEVEATVVLHGSIWEVSAGGFGDVVGRFSLVVAAVCENARARPFSASVLKTAHIDSTVLLEQFAPTEGRPFYLSPHLPHRAVRSRFPRPLARCVRFGGRPVAFRMACMVAWLRFS